MNKIKAIEGMESHREGEYSAYYQVGLQTHGGKYVRHISGRMDTISKAYQYDVWVAKYGCASKTVGFKCIC